MMALFDLSSTSMTLVFAGVNTTLAYRLSNENVIKVPKMSLLQYQITAALITCLIIATVIGNSLVILCFILEKAIRTFNNIFIMSLAMADLLVGIIIMPLTLVYDVSGRWTFGGPVCQVLQYLDAVCCCCSILNLCAISMVRYLSITHPLKYSSSVKKPAKAVYIVAMLWSLALIINFPSIVGMSSSTYQYEKNQPLKFIIKRSKGYIIYTVISTYFLPLFIIIFASVSIIIALRKSRLKIGILPPRVSDSRDTPGVSVDLSSCAGTSSVSGASLGDKSCFTVTGNMERPQPGEQAVENRNFLSPNVFASERFLKQEHLTSGGTHLSPDSAQSPTESTSGVVMSPTTSGSAPHSAGSSGSGKISPNVESTSSRRQSSGELHTPGVLTSNEYAQSPPSSSDELITLPEEEENKCPTKKGCEMKKGVNKGDGDTAQTYLTSQENPEDITKGTLTSITQGNTDKDMKEEDRLSTLPGHVGDGAPKVKCKISSFPQILGTDALPTGRHSCLSVTAICHPDSSGIAGVGSPNLGGADDAGSSDENHLVSGGHCIDNNLLNGKEPPMRQSSCDTTSSHHDNCTVEENGDCLSHSDVLAALSDEELSDEAIEPDEVKVTQMPSFIISHDIPEPTGKHLQQNSGMHQGPLKDEKASTADTFRSATPAPKDGAGVFLAPPTILTSCDTSISPACSSTNINFLSPGTAGLRPISACDSVSAVKLSFISKAESILSGEFCKKNNGSRRSLPNVVTKKVNQKLKVTTDVVIGGNRMTGRAGHKARMRLRDLRERRAVKSLAVIAVFFTVCWTPFYLIYVATQFCQTCVVPGNVMTFTVWLGYSNSCLNPILYTVFNSAFKEAFVSIGTKIKGKCDLR